MRRLFTWPARAFRRWIVSLVTIEAVRVLRVSRGDVLVLHVARRLSSSEYSHLVQVAAKSVPFVRVMIVDREVELEVVKAK
jgi:hypothetical protein